MKRKVLVGVAVALVAAVAVGETLTDLAGNATYEGKTGIKKLLIAIDANGAITETNSAAIGVIATNAQTKSVVALTNWNAKMTATLASDAIALTNWTARVAAEEAYSAVVGAVTGGFGTVVFSDVGDFATSAQGATADIAATNWNARMDAEEAYSAVVGAVTGGFGTVVFSDVGDFATSAQGATADIAATNWAARMAATEASDAIALTNFEARVAALEAWYALGVSMGEFAPSNSPAMTVSNGVITAVTPNQ